MISGIGMVIASVTMIVSAVVEIERKKRPYFEQEIGDEKFNASTLSVFA
jgi:hypothetical protein